MFDVFNGIVKFHYLAWCKKAAAKLVIMSIIILCLVIQ